MFDVSKKLEGVVGHDMRLFGQSPCSVLAARDRHVVSGVFAFSVSCS